MTPPVAAARLVSVSPSADFVFYNLELSVAGIELQPSPLTLEQARGLLAAFALDFDALREDFLAEVRADS